MEGNEGQEKLNPLKLLSKYVRKKLGSSSVKLLVFTDQRTRNAQFKVDQPNADISRAFKQTSKKAKKAATEQDLYVDYYQVLGVDYDATDEKIRVSYRKLALKWHPDKHKDDDAVTEKFQLINEAYTVLSDPAKRLDYDLSGNFEIDKYSLGEYLTRFKGMILTCNGLGMSHSSTWSQQLTDSNECPQN